MIDIANFRREGLPDCHYIFVVITKVPDDYSGEPWIDRLKAWFRFVISKREPFANYFHEGQIVICDTDAEWTSPREAAWGAKPGKLNFAVAKFTNLEKAILCAEAVINGEN